VNVLPYDYYAEQANDTMGLSRTGLANISGAPRKHQRHADRQWRPAQGNPMGDYIAYEKGMKDGDLHRS